MSVADSCIVALKLRHYSSGIAWSRVMVEEYRQTETSNRLLDAVPTDVELLPSE